MIRAHLLDVGKSKYGDSIFLQLGDHNILIDGGNPGSYNSSGIHESIPEQLERILGTEPPFEISLLVITHAHNDHIGCLPKMVKNELIDVEWALIADPDLGWGNPVDAQHIDAQQPLEVQTVFAALREEFREGLSNDELQEFLSDSQTLRSRYSEMIETLEDAGTKVVKFVGGNEAADLVDEFSDVGMKILGPSQPMLVTCAQQIESSGRDFISQLSDSYSSDNTTSEISMYRRFTAPHTDQMDASGIGAALNCMSIVLMFELEDVRLLFTGDSQFTDPGVTGLDTMMDTLRSTVSSQAPFDLYKIGHHGSKNSFDESILEDVRGTINFGISTGRKSSHHPSTSVLQILKENVDEIFWVRTDKNGCCSFDFEVDPPSIDIDRGIYSDWRPNHIDTQPESRNVPTRISPPTHVVTHPPAKQSVPPEEKARQSSSSASDNVEVHTKVPHKKTRVVVTIEVDPGGSSDQGSEPSPREDPPRQDPPSINANLAFITDVPKLKRNIGAKPSAEHIVNFA